MMVFVVAASYPDARGDWRCDTHRMYLQKNPGRRQVRRGSFDAQVSWQAIKEKKESIVWTELFFIPLGLPRNPFLYVRDKGIFERKNL